VQKSGDVPRIPGGIDKKRPEQREQCATTSLEIGDKTVNFYGKPLKFALTPTGKGV
jgi:hypothetical protein